MLILIESILPNTFCLFNNSNLKLKYEFFKKRNFLNKFHKGKKKYILEVLNPILEELVTEILTSMPSDVHAFMIDFLNAKKGASDFGFSCLFFRP